MKLHRNAKLSVKGRELPVDRVENAGWSLTQAAEAAGVSDRTARKWIARHRAEGRDGLLDRSSAPAVVANRTDERRVEVITALRRLRFTGAEIAELLDMALSTASGILTRIGMGKLGLIEHWNGKAWKIQASPKVEAASLSGAAATSSTNTWAVGEDNRFTRPLIEHWNGRAWKIQASPNPRFNLYMGSLDDAPLTGVAATSSTNAWAVGYGHAAVYSDDEAAALIEHWNGKAWKIQRRPPADRPALRRGC